MSEPVSLCLLEIILLQGSSRIVCAVGGGRSRRNCGEEKSTKNNFNERGTEMKRFGFFMMALTLFATLFGSTAMAAERNAKKTLIIYYSNTGTTKLVAERLQKKTNADIYVIETVKTYSTKDPERTQVPKKELETGNLPALKKSPPNMSSYDLILVGGPVWWYTVSTPMMSFLRDADFAGKRVAPFNTNKGGNGDYFEAFKKEAKNGIVLDGLELYQPKAGAELDKELDAWLSLIRK